jgi:DNA processing protein
VRLHVRGAIPDGPLVAIVGARAADTTGKTFAFRLASALAENGVAVVSGGARGIDEEAHLGALEAGGKTVVVLGCGLDVEYPRGSTALRARAAEAGAVVSELGLAARPRPVNFPKRNRIVAALAEAIVVVQAGARSGALSTAHQGKALHRPILAVPGSPGSDLTRGTHGLLRSGALLAEGPEDVLAAIGRAPQPGPSRTRARPELTGLEAAVHALLQGRTCSADELARAAERPVADVLGALVQLELRGLVVSRAGCYEAMQPFVSPAPSVERA